LGREGDRSGEKQEEEEKAGEAQSPEEKALELSHELIGIETSASELEAGSVKQRPKLEAA
jgi:hypothetical protein